MHIPNIADQKSSKMRRSPSINNPQKVGLHAETLPNTAGAPRCPGTEPRIPFGRANPASVRRYVLSCWPCQLWLLRLLPSGCPPASRMCQPELRWMFWVLFVLLPSAVCHPTTDTYLAPCGRGLGRTETKPSSACHQESVHCPGILRAFWTCAASVSEAAHF